jgi:Flp pilus assembly protein TadG
MSEIRFKSLTSRRSNTQNSSGPSDRRGAILPLVALSLVGIMSLMAMTIEAGSLLRERRAAQTAADAGAVAGASEIYREQPQDSVFASANAETARNGFANGTDGVTVTVYNGPISGRHIGDIEFVEVLVTRNVTTFFGGLLGRNSVTVHARGVAGYAAPSDGCLFTLEPEDEKALNVSSGSRLEVDCGIVVNSNDPKAVVIESAGALTGDALSVTGGVDISGGSMVISGINETGVPPSLDPLSYLQPPPFNPTQCDFNNTKVDSYGVTTVLNPGIYCMGIEITSNGTASLNPGLYILRGGGLKMGGGLITGVGVSFFNTNARDADGGAEKFGKIEMGSQSRANLSAMTTGPLAGILFYQDPAAGKPGVLYENVIGSGSNAVFVGTLYFPTQPVELGASGSTTTINGGVVATMVTVTSNSQVNMDMTSGLTGQVPIKRVSLVE